MDSAHYYSNPGEVAQINGVRSESFLVFIYYYERTQIDEKHTWVKMCSQSPRKEYCLPSKVLK